MHLERDIISVNIHGKEITFETGKIARQAGGAVLARCGETLVFATACAAPSPEPTADFLPLRVDYQEKFSSAGKTVSGFIKREGRASEREILISRLIDRPLRPLFEEGYYNEVQILTYVWSYDGMHSPDPLAICSASAAIVISDIPLIKPVGAVRVGYINNQFIVNPTVEQQRQSKLDLMLAGTEDAVLMIEGFCDFLTEDQLLEAITIGHESIKIICQALLQWQKKLGKPKNRETLRLIPKELYQEIEALSHPLLEKALRMNEKKKREEELGHANKAIHAALFSEGLPPKYLPQDVNYAIKHVSSKMMRRMILNENVRSDSRKSTDIRPIDIEQGLLTRAHGSSLFTRGETQALAVCTLGGETMAQRFEDLEGEGSQRFYLQYFFPLFL